MIKMPPEDIRLLRDLHTELVRRDAGVRAVLSEMRDLSAQIETGLQAARTAILSIRSDVQAIKTKVGA